MKITRCVVSLAVWLSFEAVPALAEGVAAAPENPVWRSECSTCHVAYPPGLLTTPDWRNVMGGLERHFGSDASLDDKTREEIQAFLERHASRSSRNASFDGRITTTGWFRSEHREVPATVWRGGRVKSAAQCDACHTGAADGRYGEGEIRLPGWRRTER